MGNLTIYGLTGLEDLTEREQIELDGSIRYAIDHVDDIARKSGYEANRLKGLLSQLKTDNETREPTQ